MVVGIVYTVHERTIERPNTQLPSVSRTVRCVYKTFTNQLITCVYCNTKHVRVPNETCETRIFLNKSNTKRISVGLEHHNGYYHRVIKLISPGPSYRNVTLDENSWVNLKEHFDVVSAYLSNSYSFYQEFGRTSKIFLAKHDLNFTSTYGNRTIIIDERPPPANSKIMEEEEGEQQIFTENEEGKKKKINPNPPAVVMQQSTFEGLRTQSNLIDIHMELLNDVVGNINPTVDYVLKYLKGDLAKEGEEIAKSIFTDFKTFKLYYSTQYTAIQGFVTANMVDDNEDMYKNRYLKLVLAEIFAYDLPMIYKDLKAVVFEV